MADLPPHPGAGGFLPAETLPSPAPSTPSRAATSLPHPRAHALRPGSNKEDMVRRYADQQLMTVTRRYVKFGTAQEGDEVVGYKSFGELCRDVDGIINVLWLSGTPPLQIPFLLNIGGEFTKWMVSFPPSQAGTFAVLRKLDHCYASLLAGQDIDTKESLPGFENGLRGGMTTTDMVRCKSIVEETRVVVVDVMARERGGEDDDGWEGGTETGTETDATETESTMEAGRAASSAWDDEDDDDGFDMDVARVYEHTIVQLGERLGSGGFGGAASMA